VKPMIVKNFVEKEQYYDSVFLMRIAASLGEMPGIIQVSAGMGTPLNKDTMKELGVLDTSGEAASINDMVVGISADTIEVAEAAYASFLEMLKEKKKKTSNAHKTVEQAANANPDLNLAVVSVAGEYAAKEGMEALKKGMHVFMFSDNVPIEQEVELKQYAKEHRLLMMGPDCGLTFLDGTAIGLCSKTRRGNIGIIGASGSGIQEVMCIVHRKGYGISQAIGVGGRDLSDEVGGITMLQSIELLENDSETAVIVLISKPPAASTMEKVLSAVKTCRKPVVVQFIHGDADQIREVGAYPTSTFLETAEAAIAFSQGKQPATHHVEVDEVLAKEECKKLAKGQKYLRGLYCGGSLAEETLTLIGSQLDELHSNVTFGNIIPMDNPFVSQGNCLTDIGAEEFTKAHPHAAIDPTIRVQRLIREAADPECAILLMDVLLGYALNEDPAGVMAPVIARLKAENGKEGRGLCVIIALCGTDLDPQGYEAQKQAFEASGAIVMDSNEKAATLATKILTLKMERDGE